MALDGAQFNDEDYYSEEWSDFANSKKWWKADLTISYPSPNQITFNENSRLYIADHRIKFTTNETLSLPASASAATFYFYVEIDNINKVYSLKFADSLPIDGDLSTVYNAVFGKHIHTGGALNVSFLEENINLEERKFVHLAGNEDINGEKSFLSKLYAKASAAITGTLSVSGLASFGAGLNVDAGTTNLKNTNVTGQIVLTGNVLTDLSYYSSNDTDDFNFLLFRKKTGSVNRVIHKHINSTGEYIIQTLKNDATGSNLLKLNDQGVFTALGNAGYRKLAENYNEIEKTGLNMAVGSSTSISGITSHPYTMGFRQGHVLLSDGAILPFVLTSGDSRINASVFSPFNDGTNAYSHYVYQLVFSGANTFTLDGASFKSVSASSVVSSGTRPGIQAIRFNNYLK